MMSIPEVVGGGMERGSWRCGNLDGLALESVTKC
jgi:hypothetical protein